MKNTIEQFLLERAIIERAFVKDMISIEEKYSVCIHGIEVTRVSQPGNSNNSRLINIKIKAEV